MGPFTQEDPIGLAGGLNLYGFADGDPVNNSDPFGLSACPPLCDNFDPAKDRFIRPESGADALALGGMTVGAAVAGLALGAGGALLAGESILAAGTQAVGPLITSGRVAAVARVALGSKTGQKLTRVFSGENFRLGVSRGADGGRFVLRAAGNHVQRILGRPKLDLIDLGTIKSFMKALKR